MNAEAGWKESHWWGLWGPKRMDEWADTYLEEHKVPVSDRAWSTLLRVLQQLGWAVLAQCKAVWKVFCRLRAGEDEATTAVAKQVAARARQQRWRETEQQRLVLRATKRATAAANKESSRRWTPAFSAGHILQNSLSVSFARSALSVLCCFEHRFLLLASAPELPTSGSH